MTYRTILIDQKNLDHMVACAQQGLQCPNTMHLNGRELAEGLLHALGYDDLVVRWSQDQGELVPEDAEPLGDTVNHGPDWPCDCGLPFDHKGFCYGERS